LGIVGAGLFTGWIVFPSSNSVETQNIETLSDNLSNNKLHYYYKTFPIICLHTQIFFSFTKGLPCLLIITIIALGTAEMRLFYRPDTQTTSSEHTQCQLNYG